MSSTAGLLLHEKLARCQACCTAHVQASVDALLSIQYWHQRYCSLKMIAGYNSL